ETEQETEQETEEIEQEIKEESHEEENDMSGQVPTENFDVKIEDVIAAAQKQVEEMVKSESGPELELEPEPECSPMEGIEETKSEPPAPELVSVAAVLESETMSSGQTDQPGQSMDRSLSGSTVSSGRGVGFATMIKDPFLIRIEQELSSWEPVLG
ncbi:hypothetical protein BG000_003719, partial [Podila horticola]